MSIRDTLISGDEARDIRARVDQYAEWAEQFRKPNGWTVITPDEQKRAPVTVTNEERGRLEQYEVWRDPPESLFCYVSPLGDGRIKAAVWTGDPLGFGNWGDEYRSNFGDGRRSVRVIIAGYVYSGTAFVTAGDYARLRRGKRHPH